MDLKIAFDSQNIFLFHLYEVLSQEIYNEDVHPSAQFIYNRLFFFSMLDRYVFFMQSAVLVPF